MGNVKDSPNCDVPFKITNKLKVNNDNFKSNGDFKRHITVKKTPSAKITHSISLIYIFMQNG